MTLTAGDRLGPYEILVLAGSGGMGEVYRARDSRMARDVAVKILPPQVAADPDRMQRFELEARAAGMLNHPNLLTVFDIGTHEGTPYIVTEFLEGETLREKLNAGAAPRTGSSASAALPARKVIDWAQQLAAGLAAAHDKRIVHRDLKPENIFITRDGRVKILDFGLAKLLTGPIGQNDTTQQRGTDPGTVMGTVGYMSPEQVRAQPIDHRSDIFSLGAILYEMFTGARAFRGNSSADTMSAILREDPPEIATLNPSVSPVVERIVRHCLEKSPDERFQSARDLSFDLGAISTDSRRSESAPASPRRRRQVLAAGLVLLALVAGFAGGWLAARRSRSAPLPPPRPRLLTFSGRDSSPAVSPDRRSMVFASERDGRRRLWLKELATGGEVPITDGYDDFPRYSPDGSTLLFIRTENGVPSLYRTAVVGGTPRRLIPRVSSADYTPDGKHIVYVPYPDVDSIGSKVAIATADGSGQRILAAFQRILNSPRCSPDAKWIALADSTPGNLGRAVWLVSMDGRSSRQVPLAKGAGTVAPIAWADATHLVYGAPEAITGFLAGVPQQLVLADILTNELTPLASVVSGFSLDVAGPSRLIFDGIIQRQNLREVALDGSTAPRWFSRGNAVDRQPVYSPDGQWIAFSSNRSGNLDVWMVNRRTGVVARITDDAAEDFDPGFTPDGRHLVWSSNRSGAFEIWVAEPDGSAARQLTNDGVDAENPTVTPDGKWVIYSSYNSKNPGVWMIGINGGAVKALWRGAGELPETSPDGKWVSFHEINGNRVMVAEVATGRTVVMATLTTRPLAAAAGRTRWSADGQSLLWSDCDQQGEWTLQQQAFLGTQDTSATRRTLMSTESPTFIESFGTSRDGKYVITSVSDTLSGIYTVDNVRLH